MFQKLKEFFFGKKTKEEKSVDVSEPVTSVPAINDQITDAVTQTAPKKPRYQRKPKSTKSTDSKPVAKKKSVPAMKVEKSKSTKKTTKNKQ